MIGVRFLVEMGYYYYMERGMCIFWILVQQLCYIWLRGACSELSGGRRLSPRFCASQALLFAAVCALCFADWLGFGFAFFGPRAPSWARFEPWQRAGNIFAVTACSAMLCFDAAIVIYAERCRAWCAGGRTPGRAGLADAALFGGAAAFAAFWVWASDEAAIRLGYGPDVYHRVRQFFVQLANIGYVALEISMAIIFYRLYKALKCPATRRELTEKNPATRRELTEKNPATRRELTERRDAK